MSLWLREDDLEISEETSDPAAPSGAKKLVARQRYLSYGELPNNALVPRSRCGWPSFHFLHSPHPKSTMPPPNTHAQTTDTHMHRHIDMGTQTHTDTYRDTHRHTDTDRQTHTDEVPRDHEFQPHLRFCTECRACLGFSFSLSLSLSLSLSALPLLVHMHALSLSLKINKLKKKKMLIINKLF